MREIKFRVWEPINKKMDCFEFTLYKFSSGTNSHKFVLPPNRQSMQNPYTIMNMDAVAIMQYTGLKDIHGKEIFEGDVLACVNYTNVVETVIYSNEKGGYWSSDDILLSEMMADEEYDFEIIGNIYENPELN